MSIKTFSMSPFAAVDTDRVQISHRAASMGLASDGHLADVFGMDMIQSATSPTGYTAAQAYYALDQATEAGDFMGARNVGSMSQEEAMEIFGAYVEGYREGLAVADTDTFAGLFSKGRIRRYKKQMERYTAARSANNQKKAARALGRMKALWGRMSESDRQGLTSPDKLAVPGVEVAKATSSKAAKADQKISKDDAVSTDAADAESSAEEAMGAVFGADGAKAYKSRKAYIEAAIKGRASGTLSLSALEPLFAAVKAKKGLPTPAQIVAGAEVTLDMVIPDAKKSVVYQSGKIVGGPLVQPAGSSNAMYGAEDLEIDAEMNAEDVMGAVFGADGVKDYKNRKAYVEKAMKAIAEGKLGKVNLVTLWKKIKGRKGLPSPSEIKDGAEVTADMAIPQSSSSMGADEDQDYLNRKAYVETAVNTVATGRLGKVNLVKLWKLVKGRQGLPSPSEIKAGTPITLSMIAPPAAMGYDDYGADEDQDYLNRKAYVEAAVNAVSTGRLGKVNLVKLWKLVKGRQGLPSPAQIKAGTPITLSMSAPPAAMGYDFGDDGLPEDDSDIDAVLGADDDEDMDDLGADEDQDYLNRKAYVEAAVNAVSTGRLGKVNLVKLWKLVKGRQGLPSPAQIKAGTPITLSMIAPPAAMGYDFGDDGLPEDDSDIDAVLGADDDEDMDDLGGDEFGLSLGNPTAYARYRRQFNEKISKGKIGGASRDWKQIKNSWDKLKSGERRGLSNPNEILADIGKSHFKAVVDATGVDSTTLKKLIEKRKAQKSKTSPTTSTSTSSSGSSLATLVAASKDAQGTSTTAAMGYDFGDDGLPEDDSDIDAVLGADDDEDMDDLGADDDEDMDDLGADDDEDMDELGATAIGTRNAYRRNVKDLFQALKRNKSDKVKKNWGQLKRIWAKLTKNERREVKNLDAVLKEAGKENMAMMIWATGKTKEQILQVGKKKPTTTTTSTEVETETEEAAMGYDFGDDGLPDDDSDIDAVLGADDDDDMDDLGADDDDDMDDLGADDDDDMDDLGADEDDDDDFGLDNIEMDLDLDVQRALVNRYSGADQPFPAGGAAPFPGPRMAGHEVF